MRNISSPLRFSFSFSFHRLNVSRSIVIRSVEMGGFGSRSRQSQVPFPPLYPRGNTAQPYTGIPSSPSSLPPSIYGPPMGPGASPLSRRQQKQLEEANRTIQNLQNQMMAMQQRTAGPPIINPYSSSLPPLSSSPPPPPPGSYRPPSPLLQQLASQPPPPYGAPPSAAGFRDTDYAAIANISGLNPNDVALLHREYVNLTRGGLNKIDRVVFRQLLRESMIEANNENIDRAIENIFVHIDRNRDGFIDFPEFIGAFRDLLRANAPDPLSYLNQPASYADPITSLAQSLSSPTVGQPPVVYNGPNPLVLSLDSNPSSYVINPQVQTSALQCVPLPMI